MSSATRSIRCSSLPLLFKCPPAVLEGGLRIDPDNEAAAAGTATHAALETLPTTGVAAWERIEALAKEHGCEAKDVEVLVAQGTKLWESVGHMFEGAIVERSAVAEIAPGFEISGHWDLLAPPVVDKQVLGDWKSSRLDPDYRDQMLGYAALALLVDPTVNEVAGLVLWIRDGEGEWHRMKRDELAAWIERLLAAVNGPQTYRPGNHCLWCSRRPECSAVGAMERTSVMAIADRDDTDLTQYSPDAILLLHERASYVEKVAKQAKDAVREHVRAYGDVVTDGGRLTLQAQNRRDLDVLKATEVLKGAGFTAEEIAQCSKLSTGEINKVTKSKAMPRHGASDIRAMDERLKEAGAVSTTEIQILRRKRV